MNVETQLNRITEILAVGFSELDKRVLNAVKNDELKVHYQPRVMMHTGEIVGAEALLRWNPVGIDPISTDEFIARAENTGAIHEVTRWVMKQACHDAAVFLKKWENFTIGVNLSAVCVSSEKLQELVQAVLASSKIPANKLELEITESQIIDDPILAIEVMREIGATGVRWALDDFGTGYSTLNMLSQIPLDILKIDRAFIARLTHTKVDVEVAKAIHNLGKACGMDVIAEGMETQDEVDILLNEIGCEIAQGYYYAKPMSRDDFLKL